MKIEEHALVACYSKSKCNEKEKVNHTCEDVIVTLYLKDKLLETT